MVLSLHTCLSHYENIIATTCTGPHTMLGVAVWDSLHAHKKVLRLSLPTDACIADSQRSAPIQRPRHITLCSTQVFLKVDTYSWREKFLGIICAVCELRTRTLRQTCSTQQARRKSRPRSCASISLSDLLMCRLCTVVHIKGLQ